MKKRIIKRKTIIVTGATGFIGANLVIKLIKTCEPMKLVGLDNLNDYYDVSIKEYRLAEIEKLVAENEQVDWWFIEGDLADKALIDSAFAVHRFDMVVNLAAQAGVRYSITNPDAYINSNIIGFYNILEACRHSYDNGAKGYRTLGWFILHRHRFAAAIKRYCFQRSIKWTILFLFVRQPKRAMSCWHMLALSFIVFHQSVCVSPQFTVCRTSQLRVRRKGKIFIRV